MFSLKKAAVSAFIALAAVTQQIPSALAQGYTYVNPGYAFNTINTLLPYLGGYGGYGYNPYSYNPYSYNLNSYGVQYPLYGGNLYGYNSYNAYSYPGNYGYRGGYGYGYPGAYSYSGYPTGAYAASTAIGLGLSLLQTGLYYRNYRNAYRGYGQYYY